MLGVPAAVLAEQLLARLDEGAPTWLATLIAREGHAYRAPGARLLIGADPARPQDAPRPLAGRLSGGCVEDEVAARASEATHGARIVRIDTADDGPYGLGLGCGGVLDVVIEPLPTQGEAATGWRTWATAVRDGRPALRWIGPEGTTAWRTDERVDGAWSGVARSGGSSPENERFRGARSDDEAPLCAGADDVHARLSPSGAGWLERTPAPPRLWVVGLDDDALAVARTLLSHGWRVDLVASSRARLDESADDLAARTGRRPTVRVVDARSVASLPVAPEDRVLAASHRLDLDAAALAVALAAGARWMGAVASRVRREALLRQAPLAQAIADDPTALARIEAPAGLDLGGRGAEEVAAAIVARLVQDLRAAARPVTAIVPAAGEGRRLGGGKPLLSDGRETLIARAVRRASWVSDEVIVVVGHDAQRVSEAVPGHARVVHAAAWRDGLSASLAAGITAADPRARVLVVLPDMPGVTAAHLADLTRSAGHHPTRAAGAVSLYAGGRRGVPALLPDDRVRAVRGGLELPSGDRGFSDAWAKRADLLDVPLGADHDLDTPEDAARHGWRPVAR